MNSLRAPAQNYHNLELWQTRVVGAADGGIIQDTDAGRNYC